MARRLVSNAVLLVVACLAATAWAQGSDSGDGNGPTSRFGAAMVPFKTDSVVLFGGHTGDSVVNDLWMMSGREWVQVEVDSSELAPAGRFMSSATMVDTTLFVFGGCVDPGVTTICFDHADDLWSINLEPVNGTMPIWSHVSGHAKSGAALVRPAIALMAAAAAAAVALMTASSD